MASDRPVPPYKVRALYEYSSPHDDDLNFGANQVILVTAEEDDEWSFGEYTKEGQTIKGIFPRNYIEIIKEAAVPTPPRPVRHASKPSTSIPPPQQQLQEIPAPVQPELGEHEAEVTTRQQPAAELVAETPEHASGQPSAPVSTATKPVERKEIVSPDPVVETKPKPVKPAPAPKNVGEDKGAPAATGSFRDRIAAFNKTQAPPIAPFQASKPSTFIKKPFVAPPPSKNAYVSPPIQQTNVVRRDEETVVRPPAEDIVSESTSADAADAPKVSSLKDRIALLQSTRLATGPPTKPKPKHVKQESRANIEAPTVEPRHVDNQEDDHDVTMTQNDNLSRVDTGESQVEEAPRQLPIPIPQMYKEPPQSSDDETEHQEDLESSKTQEHHVASQMENLSIAESGEPIEGQRKIEDIGNSDADAEEEEEEEEEVDPEVARRLAIRERMMKMSGGMGMYGIMPPVAPMAVPKKKSSEPKPAAQTEGAAMTRSKSRESLARDDDQRPVPVQLPQIPMPMQIPTKTMEGEPMTEEQQEEHEQQNVETYRVQPSVPQMLDIGQRASQEGQHNDRPSSSRSDLPSPAFSRKSTNAPRPKSGYNNMSPIVTDTASPVATPQPKFDEQQTEGSVSDDEMSVRGSSKVNVNVIPLQESSSVGDPTPLPRMQSFSSTNNDIRRQSQYAGTPGSSHTASPSTPGLNKRMSFHSKGAPMPPIPGAVSTQTTAQISSPIARAPPPPPPTSMPPTSTIRHVPQERGNLDDMGMTPHVASEGEGETTEYEADYDTDIASGEGHKDALKAVDNSEETSSVDNDYNEDTPLPSPSELRSPPPPPPPTSAPRMPPSIPQIPPPPLPPAPPISAAPPPPPSMSSPPPPIPAGVPQQQRRTRESMDIPRGAPPPPPPPAPPAPPAFTAPPVQRQESYPRDEYGNYEEDVDSPTTDYRQEPSTSSYSPAQSYPSAPKRESSQPGTSRGSMDLLRTSNVGNSRRSTDLNRMAMEHSYIATDEDLGRSSQWWTKTNTPPPVFQGREKEMTIEYEESTVTRRGGSTMTTRDVYILFQDFSQTIVTARFDPHYPEDVALEQRHEPPPPPLRQDQLENASTTYGAKIIEHVTGKQNAVVGDGEAYTLVMDLLKQLPDALMPAGTRSFGALIYANLGNATVQQYDEIRPGDIITFRNARFQGHKGGLHQKYQMEIATKGKMEHVAIVLDWDGTKKKVRAYEQGRESKKVKLESFRLGDLKSGECKVWRIVKKTWVYPQ